MRRVEKHPALSAPYEPRQVYMETADVYVEALPPHARVNLGKRPWPANPAEYPLSGPSRGSVYMPPELDDAPTPLWVKIILAFAAAVTFYGAFCVVVLCSYTFAAALFG